MTLALMAVRQEVNNFESSLVVHELELKIKPNNARINDMLSLICIFVALVVSYFGFDSILVLIALVSFHCMLFTFLLSVNTTACTST